MTKRCPKEFIGWLATPNRHPQIREFYPVNPNPLYTEEWAGGAEALLIWKAKEKRWGLSLYDPSFPYRHLCTVEDKNPKKLWAHYITWKLTGDLP